jgi:hypothetical protein
MGTRASACVVVTLQLRARPRGALEGTGAPDRPVPGRGVPVLLAQAAARAGERHLGGCGQAARINVRQGPGYGRSPVALSQPSRLICSCMKSAQRLADSSVG